MEKKKNILTICLFLFVIFSMFFSLIILPDNEVSYAERRKLEQLSSLGEVSVFDGEFSSKLEAYLLDQFPMRDKYRSINAFTRYWVLLQKNVNGLWTDNGSIFKNEGNYNENQVLYGTQLINKLCDTTLKGMNIYYSVIPDKNYFLPQGKGYPRFEYEKLFSVLNQNIKNAKYIDITDTLELADYYKTDTHWSQDKIFKTVQRLAQGINISDELTGEDEYTKHEIKQFYGVYWGQAALAAKPDSLYYMTSKYTDNAKVSTIDAKILKEKFGVTDNLSKEVYAIDKFDGMDGYDVFLSGAQPLVYIENEDAKTDRELIIFRDSFSSSLAPLFTGAYKKITLIDLRYIPSMLLEDYVEFNQGQDVLFLYSTTMYNRSMLLK